MSINITGQGVEITTAIHDKTIEKFKGIQRYLKRIPITNTHIIFAVSKHSGKPHEVKATMHVPGEMIVAKANEDDMYTALDLMMNRLAEKAKKYKEKIISKRHDDGLD